MNRIYKFVKRDKTCFVTGITHQLPKDKWDNFLKSPAINLCRLDVDINFVEYGEDISNERYNAKRNTIVQLTDEERETYDYKQKALRLVDYWYLSMQLSVEDKPLTMDFTTLDGKTCDEVLNDRLTKRMPLDIDVERYCKAVEAGSRQRIERDLNGEYSCDSYGDKEWEKVFKVMAEGINDTTTDKGLEVTERTKAWVDLIEETDFNTATLMCGVAHLFYKDGLMSLLKNAGYVCEDVTAEFSN